MAAITVLLPEDSSSSPKKSGLGRCRQERADGTLSMNSKVPSTILMVDSCSIGECSQSVHSNHPNNQSGTPRPLQQTSSSPFLAWAFPPMKTSVPNGLMWPFWWATKWPIWAYMNYMQAYSRTSYACRQLHGTHVYFKKPSPTPVLQLNTFRTDELDYSKTFIVLSLSRDVDVLRCSLQCLHGTKQARKNKAIKIFTEYSNWWRWMRPDGQHSTEDYVETKCILSFKLPNISFSFSHDPY